MRTARSDDGQRALLTVVTYPPDCGERGVETPAVVRTHQVGAIIAGYSDQVWVFVQGLPMEVRGSLVEVERAVFGRTAGFAELWTGERDG